MRRPEDLRRFRRKTVRVLVDYTCPGGVRCDYATTLGAGGMFLQTEENLAPGQRLKLRFRLPDSDTLHEIEGRVVWSRFFKEGTVVAPGVGVQFTDGGAAARLARDLDDLQ